jgi:hypothetical protein
LDRYTNPLSEKHKWSGSFTVTITEEDKRNHGFSGSYSAGEKIENGRYGHETLTWDRPTRPDGRGSNMQTWTVNKIERTKENIKITGTWSGSFDWCCDHKADDSDFAALKPLKH